MTEELGGPGLDIVLRLLSFIGSNRQRSLSDPRADKNCIERTVLFDPKRNNPTWNLGVRL